MTTRTREDLVADMERFATSLPGVMAADAQVALIVPGNLTDEETQRVAAAVPEGARISVFTDATRAGWSNGKKIVWGQNDGGLHDWRRATTVGDGPVATFTVSMHDVLDAWRSKYVVYNEDGDGHYTDTPDTVEEAIIIAAANQLAMSVKGEYIKTIVGETVRSLVAQLAAGDIREWVTEALQNPVQLTNTMGRPEGAPTTFFELAQKQLTEVLTAKEYNARGERRTTGSFRDGYNLTLPELVIRQRVTGHLKKELETVVDEAKAEAVGAVKDEATQIVTDVLAKRLASIAEGRS